MIRPLMLLALALLPRVAQADPLKYPYELAFQRQGRTVRYEGKTASYKPVELPAVEAALQGLVARVEACRDAQAAAGRSSTVGTLVVELNAGGASELGRARISEPQPVADPELVTCVQTAVRDEWRLDGVEHLQLGVLHLWDGFAVMTLRFYIWNGG